MSVVFGNSSGHIWGLVQRAIRDAGFKAAPAHVAILDKGQRSVKGLNSGSESVVTVDLILTVQKPANAESADDAHALKMATRSVSLTKSSKNYPPMRREIPAMSMPGFFAKPSTNTTRWTSSI